MSHLLLCLTPGVGLSRWRELGILRRELSLYVQYRESGWNVSILDFGPPTREYGFSVLTAALHLPIWLSVLARLGAFRRADVVKTNQSWRCWWYVLAARLVRTPIAVRCGWLPGRYLEVSEGRSLRLSAYRFLEGLAMRFANRVIFTSSADCEWAISHYRVRRARCSVVPNFVDMRHFVPSGESPKTDSIIYVGRLVPVKNVDVLLRAASFAGAKAVTIVGQGPEIERLRALARELGISVDFTGIVDNEQLPRMLCRHQVFCLPSSVEGHPKALLEAMACGLACVTSRANGSEEVIEDDLDGKLVDPDADTLAGVFRQIFSDSVLRRRLGEGARRKAERLFSLETYQLAESKVLLDLLSSRGGKA